MIRIKSRIKIYEEIFHPRKERRKIEDLITIAKKHIKIQETDVYGLLRKEQQKYKINHEMNFKPKKHYHTPFFINEIIKEDNLRAIRIKSQLNIRKDLNSRDEPRTVCIKKYVEPEEKKPTRPILGEHSRYKKNLRKDLILYGIKQSSHNPVFNFLNTTTSSFYNRSEVINLPKVKNQHKKKKIILNTFYNTDFTNRASVNTSGSMTFLNSAKGEVSVSSQFSKIKGASSVMV